jgi:hypothetical protein
VSPPANDGKLTENSSTNPQTRSAHANATTETVKLTLPSKVLGVVGDHLYRPTLFPTTDACVHIISPLAINNHIPIYDQHSPWRLLPQLSRFQCTIVIGKDCRNFQLSIVTRLNFLASKKRVLTPQTKVHLRTLSAGKSG